MKKNLLFHAITVMLLVLMGLVAVFYFLHGLAWNGERSASLNGPFVLTENGNVHEGVNLSDFNFGRRLAKNEVITIEGFLPSNLPEQSTVRVLSYLSAVDIEVGGEAVYSYGHDLLGQGEMAGSGYHFAELPTSPGGRDIKVTFTTGEDNAFSSIPSIDLYESGSVYVDFATSQFWNIFIGVFLFSFGSIISLISLFMMFRRDRYIRMLYVGLFSQLISIWIMMTTKSVQVLISDLAYCTVLEYITLYSAFIPFCLLILHIRGDGNDRVSRILLCANAIITAAFDVLAIVLHFTNVIHISQMLNVFHILCVIVLVTFFITALRVKGEKTHSARLLNIAVLTMFIFGAIDLIRFNLQKYLFPTTTFLSSSILPFGALMFIVMLFLSTLSYYYELVLEDAKNESLKQSAYTDPVTGLFNRAYCEKRFQVLSMDRDNDYILVAMDLNDLKKTNDTFGHSVGDELIRRFSNVIGKIFDGIGECVRMGGDEFCVISEGGNAQAIEEALKRLPETERKNSIGMATPISSAYGVARSTEVKPDEREEKARGRLYAEYIYSLADERMYRMKNYMKEDAAIAKKKSF